MALRRPDTEAPAPARRSQAARRAAMRERLLDATVDCLAEVGYAGTTTTEVVRRAGVSRGAQVHHFPTKADLVVAAIDHVLARRQEEFRIGFAALAPGQRTMARALELLWQQYQSPTFAAWLELALASRNDPALKAPFLQVCERFGATADATFRELFPEASDAPWARLTTQFAFALLDGLGLARAVGTGDDAEAVLGLLTSLATLYAPTIGGQP